MEYSDLYVKRIRTLCKERGLAINKLATMSDVKQSTLDNIVRGLTKNPRVKTLHKIALAFNMTLAEFLELPGVGETKARRYGAPFLEVLRSWQASEGE